jgi:Flp pilus assembly protein TadG
MLGKILGRWFKAKEGSTAIEFSLMAVPYLVLSLGIIELGIMYASASMLEGATSHASRMIRTGQLQQSSSVTPQRDFEEELCDYASVLLDCSLVVVEVIPMQSYNDYSNLAPQFDENGDMISGGFNAGGSNDRILIRTAYRYQMLTPFIGQLLAPPIGERLFMSTLVLQTEPYEFGGV